MITFVIIQFAGRVYKGMIIPRESYGQEIYLELTASFSLFYPKVKHQCKSPSLCSPYIPADRESPNLFHLSSTIFLPCNLRAMCVTY